MENKLSKRKTLKNKWKKNIDNINIMRQEQIKIYLTVFLDFFGNNFGTENMIKEKVRKLKNKDKIREIVGIMNSETKSGIDVM